MDSELNTVWAINYRLSSRGFRIKLREGYDQWDIHCLTCREIAGYISGIMLSIVPPQGLANALDGIIINHNCYMNELQNVYGTFGYMWLE